MGLSGIFLLRSMLAEASDAEKKWCPVKDGGAFPISRKRAQEAQMLLFTAVFALIFAALGAFALAAVVALFAVGGGS